MLPHFCSIIAKESSISSFTSEMDIRSSILLEVGAMCQIQGCSDSKMPAHALGRYYLALKSANIHQHGTDYSWHQPGIGLFILCYTKRIRPIILWFSYCSAPWVSQKESLAMLNPTVVVLTTIIIGSFIWSSYQLLLVSTLEWCSSILPCILGTMLGCDCTVSAQTVDMDQTF